MNDTRDVPVRHHHLVKMDDAPIFARAAMLGVEEDGTGDEDKGSATHAIVFNTQSVVAAPMPRDETKEKYREWAAQYDGCRIVTKSELEHAQRLADAVRRSSEAMRLIEGGQCEVTRLFNFKGRVCQATPDVVRPRCIVDLKTAKKAGPKNFAWQAEDLHYHSAMSWYQRAVPKASEVFLVVVDKRAPYPVAIYRYEEWALQAGREQHEAWFDALLECERTGHWPGFTSNNEPLPLGLPRRGRVLQQVA